MVHFCFVDTIGFQRVRQEFHNKQFILTGAVIENCPIHFVVASPRSGTTWLTQALNRHPQILATELRLFGDYWEVYPNHDGTASPRQTVDCFAKNFSYHIRTSFPQIEPRKFTEEFQSSLLEFLVQYPLQKSGKNTIVDKITPYPGTADIVLQKIHRFFPQAKIIHLIRDGRDVVTSGAFDWINRGTDVQTTDRYQYYVANQSARSPIRFFDDQVLDEWSRLWLEPQAAFSSRPGLKRLTVSYEAMLENQPRELDRIFQYLQMESTAALSQQIADEVTFEKLTGRKPGEAIPAAKARKGIQGDWRNYFTQQDAKRFQAVCGPMLVTHGYEADDSWVQRCPEVLEQT